MFAIICSIYLILSTYVCLSLSLSTPPLKQAHIKRAFCIMVRFIEIVEECFNNKRIIRDMKFAWIDAKAKLILLS